LKQRGLTVVATPAVRFEEGLNLAPRRLLDLGKRGEEFGVGGAWTRGDATKPRRRWRARKGIDGARAAGWKIRLFF